MWIFLSDAMISVVQHTDNHRLLHVRARVRGDLEKIFPNAKVTETQGVGRDYAFRCNVTREELKVALTTEVNLLDYPNFKGSIGKGQLGDERHHWYMDVWTASKRAQMVSSLNSKPKRKRARKSKKIADIEFVNHRSDCDVPACLGECCAWVTGGGALQ